ncbi:MAG: iron-containing alcohol dehydrogenase [Chloroflexi bacterium]|nr:iron-containing alcohol dehydrogenase [Chloroflexota bacterium]
MQVSKFTLPEIVVGCGVLEQAGKAARRLGATRVLVVSDPGVIAAGWLEQMLPVIEHEGLDFAIWTGVTPNPKDYEVEAGAAFYRAQHCDGLVVLGGGSCIDAAKGIAVLSTNGGRIHDYEGIDRITRPLPPLVAIPTTAGTGADVSQFAVITDSDRRVKMTLISKSLVPDISLTDPLLLTTKDAWLTASTGMDALTHGIESYVSLAATFLTEVHSLRAISLAVAGLRRSVASQSDLEAKELMARSSLHAGMAFSNAILGATHAMAHQVGGLLDQPHGELNAILLPTVMTYNLPACPERYATIAEAMGLPVAGLTPLEAGALAIEAVRALVADVGLSKRLADLGVKECDLPTLSANAMHDACMATNPREATVEAVMELFYTAM